MSAALERIRIEARSLPLDEREALLNLLDFDLRGDDASEEPGPPAEAAWETEIGNRVAEVESDTVTLLSREQFMSAFDEAREELRGHRAK